MYIGLKFFFHMHHTYETYVYNITVLTMCVLHTFKTETFHLQ